MQLNGLQKTTALRLIEGVEIQQDTSNFSVNFLTVVPFFKVPYNSSLHYESPGVTTSTGICGRRATTCTGMQCFDSSSIRVDLAAQFHYV